MEGRNLLLATAQGAFTWILIYADGNTTAALCNGQPFYRWLLDTVNNTAAMWGRALCG